MKPFKKDTPIIGIQGIISAGEKSGREGESEENLIKYLDTDGHTI